jgi:cytochrome c
MLKAYRSPQFSDLWRVIDLVRQSTERFPMGKRNFMVVVVVAASAMLGATQGHASDELARKSGCAMCHAVDKKMVGPSYKDVAGKYKTQKNAESMLAGKIKNGSTGVWGSLPMPATTGLSDADAAALAKWILSQ